MSSQRSSSTLPTQALYMMNSPFVIDQARHAARRLLAEQAWDDEARIERAYLRTLGRPPTEGERELALTYIRDFQADDPLVGDQLEAWSSFCHSLFACLDFRYVD